MPEGIAVERERKPLGLPTLTALVVGNMVGSGVFMLPAALAPYGGASLLGWLASTLGSALLGLVFARLASRVPAAGGPYAYTREAFGDFAGFLAGWGYWISCWAALAAIATAMVGYLGKLVPALSVTPPTSTAVALTAIVLLTALNVAGVKGAGLMQFATTLLKLLPLAAVAVFGLAHVERSHFEPFNPTDQSLPMAVYSCIALTLWPFLGLESATVPAGEVRDPRRTIPRATLLGIAIAAALYVASTVGVMSVVPRAQLATSQAPFADAAEALWGPGAGKFVAAGAFVSCFGALNGWTLVAGQLPAAIARDGLFPAVFGRTSSRGTPAFALILSGALACIVVLGNMASSLVAMFTALALIATLASVIPLVFCTMAEPMLALRARKNGGHEPLALGIAISVLAFAYGVLAVASTGKDYVFWALLAALAGLPLYVAVRSRRPA